MTDIAQLIVGTWRLVHSIIIEADGKKRYPFGEDAIGYIYYSGTGLMAVQISRKARAEVKELARLKHDYLAYFGRYELDPTGRWSAISWRGNSSAIIPGCSKGSTGSRVISCRSGRWIGLIKKFCGNGSDENPFPKSTQ